MRRPGRSPHGTYRPGALTSGPSIRRAYLGAEFELLHSQALRDLAEKNMDAVDAVLPRLSGLAVVLVAPEVTVMYDDNVFRRLREAVDGGSDQAV